MSQNNRGSHTEPSVAPRLKPGLPAVKATQLTTELRVSLPGWQPEPFGPLSETACGAQRQQFLCGWYLITATSHNLKFFLSPQGKHSSVSQRSHLWALGFCLPLPLPKAPPKCPMVSLLFSGLPHSHALLWYLCLLLNSFKKPLLAEAFVLFSNTDE